MEFLRKLVFERPHFTQTFLDFESVGELPEEEMYDEVEDNEEEESMDVDMDDCSAASSSTQSASSQCSQQSIDMKLRCNACEKRQKDVVMSCGHSVCTTCFDKVKVDRIAECANTRGAKKRAALEKKLNCPFPKCGKSINYEAIHLNFDL